MSESVSFEEYLREHDTLTYSNKGASMEPLLRQGRDLFTVRKKGAERCRAGDVVLFRRGENYVLHRIVEVRSEEYVCQGDNTVRAEFGVTDEDILGVMTGFVRKGRKHSVSEPLYRVYTGAMLCTRGMRVLCKRAAMKVKGLLRP